MRSGWLNRLSTRAARGVTNFRANKGFGLAISQLRVRYTFDLHSLGFHAPTIQRPGRLQ